MLIRIPCLLLCISHIAQSLRCFSGHPSAPTLCTSLSYCVTMKQRNGIMQRSCDGNAVQQISLCALNPTRRRSGGVPSDYAHFGGGKSSRYAPPEPTCFNGGDLGEICCCNTDYCNSAILQKLWIPFVSLLLVAIHQLL